MKQTYSVYYLLDPHTEQVRYVGYSKHPSVRYRRAHLKAVRKGHRDNWIRSLLAIGLKPQLSICCILETKEEAVRIEIALIALLRQRGIDLVNTTVGGEGGDPYARQRELGLSIIRTPNSKPMSVEVRAKISKAIKGRPASNKGKPAHNKGKKGPASPWKGMKRANYIRKERPSY